MNVKNFSKFASIALLMLSLVICLVPLTASAASGSAEFGSDTNYGQSDSFAEAIDAANSQSGSVTTYIKLTSNVEVDAPILIATGRTVVIDLCGKTISLATGKTGGIFDVSGNLTINDSKTGGKITGAVGDSAVKLSGNAVFTMNAGEIKGNDGGAYAGGVYVGVGSSFVMNGGRIYNNNTNSGKAGGVYVEGNINLKGGARIDTNFKGGKIASGVATDSDVKSNLTLASSAVLNAAELTTSKAIGVSTVVAPTVGSPIVITKPSDKDLSKYFFTDDPSYGLINVATKGADNKTTHVLRLEARNVAFGEYTGAQLVSYTANSSSNRYKVELTTSGFADSSTVSVKWCNSEGKALTLAPTGLSALQASTLRGGKVTIEFSTTSKVAGGDYYYKVVIDGYESELKTLSVASASIVKNNATTYYKTFAEAIAAAADGDTINILDSHTVKGPISIVGKDIILAATSARTLTFVNGGIEISGGGTLTVNATGVSRTVNFAGDANNIVDYSLIKVSGANSAVTLKYSTISNGRALNNGGGIYLESGAKAELENVTISKCTSHQGEGGAIYAGANTTLNLTSVKINDCTAVKGGAIYVGSGATAALKKGTTISGCKAPGESGSSAAAGGAIYNAGSLEVNASNITSCTSTVAGGAIYHVGTKLVVTAASKITDCTATAQGGAIYLGAGTKLQINDTTVSGCLSNAGDGVYMESGATIDAFGRVVLDEIYMTASTNYIEISGLLSSDSFMSVYTASHTTGSVLVRSAGNHTISAADAKRIRLSGEVSAYSLKYVATTSNAHIELSNQAVSVGTLQGGTLKRGTAAKDLYMIGEAYGISNGVKPTITWYNDKYMTAAGSNYAPAGVTFTVGAVSGSSFTINVTSTTASKAGNYYFTVTADGIESGLNTLNIARTQIGLPTVSKTFTYSGAEQTLVLDNFNSSIMSFVSGHKAKDVGTYSAIIAISDKTQYEWTDGTDGNITINWMIERAKVARPTITTACIYKGVEQSPVINGWRDGVMEATGNKQTKVGKYTLTISLKDTKNYMWDTYSTGSVTLDWEIKKAELVVKANDVNLVYGDAPKNNGVTYTTLLGSDTAESLKGTITYTQNYTQGANAGTYTITPAGLTADNYEIKFQSGSVIVDKKPVELVWSNLSFTYDGQAHIPSVSYKSYTGSEKLAVSGAQVKAGKHTATATGFTHTNYKLANPTVEFEIAKVELTVKANDAIVTYGDPLTSLNPGYTVTGFVSGESASVLGGSVTYSTNYVLYGDVGGNFTVTPAGLTSDNYSFKYVDGNLSVKKRVVKVAADDIYSADGSDKLTYKLVEGNFVNGDEKFLALARSEGTEPGKYPIAGSLSNGNYEFTFIPGSYYILSYDVEVKGNNYGVVLKAVDGIDPELRAGVTPMEVKDYKKIDTEGRAIAVYKIVFDKNGEETAPEGKIKITLPFDEKYADEELIIKRIDANGTATALYTTKNGTTLEAEITNMDSGASYAIYTLAASYGWIWWVIGGVVLLGIGGVCVYVFVIKGREEGDYSEEDEETEEEN